MIRQQVHTCGLRGHQTAPCQPSLKPLGNLYEVLEQALSLSVHDCSACC